MATIQTRTNKAGRTTYRVGFYEAGRFQWLPALAREAGAQRVKAIVEDPRSFRNRHTPSDGPEDARFDIKVVYQQKQTEFAHPDVPSVFRPTTGSLGLHDLNNIFATCRPTHGEDIFEARGISRDGAVVVVRPDQYVSGVFGLDEVDRLNAFFAGVLLDAN